MQKFQTDIELGREQETQANQESQTQHQLYGKPMLPYSSMFIFSSTNPYVIKFLLKNSGNFEMQCGLNNF